MAPVTGAVVKPLPLSAISCCFSIVNFGSQAQEGRGGIPCGARLICAAAGAAPSTEPNPASAQAQLAKTARRASLRLFMDSLQGGLIAITLRFRSPEAAIHPSLDGSKRILPFLATSPRVLRRVNN